MRTLEVTIPFDGFYESNADATFDHEIEQMFSDEYGEPFYSLVEQAMTNCDWQSVRLKYAKMFVTSLADEIGLDGMMFKTLTSPREYNFVTDTIDAIITEYSVAKMWNNTNKETLAQVCKERHTSCSGFVSFYDPDFETWGDVKTWDHNQLGSLMIAYIKTNDFDCDEYNLMETWQCNGHIASAIEDTIPNVAKLYNELEVLRKNA